MFTDRTILITGGTGSFGHAVVRRLLRTDIKEIRILSRDEKKQDDMRKHFGNRMLKFFIGDVKDSHSLKEAFLRYGLRFSRGGFKASSFLRNVPNGSC